MGKIHPLIRKAAQAVVAQGERSLNEYGDCAYRGTSGLRCAAGFLIDDEHYSEGLETLTADEESVTLAIRKSNPGSRLKIKDLMDLQSIHDYDSFGDDFVASFKERANKRFPGLFLDENGADE